MTYDDRRHLQSALGAQGGRSSACLRASGKASHRRECFPGDLRMSKSSPGRLGQERWKGIPGIRNSACKGTEA